MSGVEVIVLSDDDDDKRGKGRASAPLPLEAFVDKVKPAKGRKGDCLFLSLLRLVRDQPTPPPFTDAVQLRAIVAREVREGRRMPAAEDVPPQVTARARARGGEERAAIREEYARWIEDGRGWGGRFELQVLADAALHIALCILILPTGTTETFRPASGAGSAPPPSAVRPLGFLIYTGEHYEPVAFRSGPGRERTLARGTAEEREYEAAALALMARERQRKGSHLTLADFTFFCEQCKTVMDGVRAEAHLNETGHTLQQREEDYAPRKGGKRSRP
jgi:hypothetical protein